MLCEQRAHLSRGFRSVHIWHREVKKNCLVHLCCFVVSYQLDSLFDLLKCLSSAIGTVRLYIFVCKDLSKNHYVHVVVIDDQHWHCRLLAY